MSDAVNHRPRREPTCATLTVSSSHVRLSEEQDSKYLLVVASDYMSIANFQLLGSISVCYSHRHAQSNSTESEFRM